jgi:hypothetical protein
MDRLGANNVLPYVCRIRAENKLPYFCTIAEVVVDILLIADVDFLFLV